MQGVMVNSVKTAEVGVFFKNLLTSSRRGHSLVKWSPRHIRQGKFSFLLFLDYKSLFLFYYSPIDFHIYLIYSFLYSSFLKSLKIEIHLPW